MDGAYDAHDLYTLIEGQGAEPIFETRKNAKAGTADARGRAIGNHRRGFATW